MALTNTLLYCASNYSFSWGLLFSRSKLTLFSLHLRVFTTQRKWSAPIKNPYLSMYRATGSSHVGSSDPFVLSFLHPAYSRSPYPQLLLFLTLSHVPDSCLHDFSHLAAGLMRGYPATKQRTSSWPKELAPSSSEPVRILMVTSPSLSGICCSQHFSASFPV